LGEGGVSAEKQNDGSEPRKLDFRESGGPQAALGAPFEFLEEPSLPPTFEPRGFRDLLKVANEQELHSPRVQSYLSHAEARQAIYLAASGNLTQFNAILAAILGAALTSIDGSVLKVAIAGALSLHVLATVFLCWAVKPVPAVQNESKALALAGNYSLVDHTFRNYRRGWRATMIALAASAVVTALFALQNLGAWSLDGVIASVRLQ
jgi:hypothetical protein